MKIRTITTGISLFSPTETEKIRHAAEFNQQAKSFFEKQGYEVQTTRITTNNWGEYLSGLSRIHLITEVTRLEQVCQELNISFFSIGSANTPEEIALIPAINKNTSVIYTSSKLGDGITGLNWENIRESAKAIKRISEETANGLGNFRFCAWANCPPEIPFFPASYHEGEMSFAIGLECSDLVAKAFSTANKLLTAEQNLQEILENELTPVEAIAHQLSNSFQLPIAYHGIDASVAPSLDKTDSIAFTYETLGLGKFGHPGTLAISALITRVLKNLSVKTCGYSGLMLPVCEDIGLAQRANEHTYNITNLLLYSAVCGCGLDTVPIPGDITIEQLEAILLDLASLAFKLDKPLSARLLPVPGKKKGEMTTFNSPYLVDSKILPIS